MGPVGVSGACGVFSVSSSNNGTSDIKRSTNDQVLLPASLPSPVAHRALVAVPNLSASLIRRPFDKAARKPLT